MALYAKRHGQGAHTPAKLDAVGRVLRQLIGMSKRGSTLSRWPFWVIDLNAGPGMNRESGLPGTPIQAVIAAGEQQRAIKCLFVDKDKSHVRALRATLRGDGTEAQALSAAMPFVDWRVFCADNNEFCLRQVDGELGEGPIFGVVIVDPNGAELPRSGLRRLLERYRQLDLVVCYSVNSLNRSRQRHGGKWDFSMSDVVASIGRWKSHCYIMPPPSGDPWRRAVIYAANYAPKSPPRGFYSTATPEGEAIVEELSKCLSQSNRTRPIANISGTRSSAQLELWSSSGQAATVSGAGIVG